MSKTYPTNEELSEICRTFITPPALKKLNEIAVAQDIPLRKLFQKVLEGYAADAQVAEWIESGERVEY